MKSLKIILIASVALALVGASVIAFNDDTVDASDPNVSNEVDTTPTVASSDGDDIMMIAGTGDEETESLWSAKVGEQEFVGLSEDSIGDILLQGQAESRVVTDSDGNKRTLRVCSGIPEIEVSKTIQTVGSEIAEGNVELFLDFATCALSVASIDHPVVNELGPTELPISPLELRYDLHKEVHDYVLALKEFDTLFPYETAPAARSSVTVIAPKVKAELKAADGAAFALTQVEIEMQYDPRNFDLYHYSTDCDTDSPAHWIAPFIGQLSGIGMTWQELDCRPGTVSAGSNFIRSSIEGDFKARTLGAQVANGSSKHTTFASIDGRSSRYTGTCRWTPGSIEDFTVTFLVLLPGAGVVPATLGVSIDCDVRGA